MRHRPQLHLPGPWDGPDIEVPTGTRSHLGRVLRLDHGAPVTYTDGCGVSGAGTWQGATVRRGSEQAHERERFLTVALAPPKAKDRQRFAVEKLQELGVGALVWVKTEHSEGRPPRADRAGQWAIAALEQSRGVFLMSIRESDVSDVGAVVALDAAAPDPLGWPAGASSAAVLVGPEGGLTPKDLAGHATARLGTTVLRTETAAVAAAAILLVRENDAGTGTPIALA